MIQILSRYTATTEERNGNIVVVATRKPVTMPSYMSHRSRYGDTLKTYPLDT